MPCTLNGSSELTLKFCACSGYTTRENFTLIVNEFPQNIYVLIVNVDKTGFGEETLFVPDFTFFGVLWIF